MKKTVLVSTAVLTLALAAGCNNFFHELVPPDENRITSFSVPGQIGQAQIGDTVISVTVGPAADTGSLVPAIAVSSKATLLPVTIPYIQKAFPSANVFREGMGFYTSQDRAGYVIDLIKRHPDFSVPALDEAIDFSVPVIFLVVSGLGNIRQYTVNVETVTGENKLLSFGFGKFDNPGLTRGDAAGTVNDNMKTVNVEVWYPVENIGSFKLIPSFQTNGAVARLEGVELTGGISVIDFGPKPPDPGGWNEVTVTKTLTVERPGFDPVDYTLNVTFKEDPDTIRSITDFRFEENLNYGVKHTAMGEITDSGDTGSITVRVHHKGAVPASLVPSFVSPGTVSIEDVPQTGGTSSHDFIRPVYYTVVSKDGLFTRNYRVTVEFINEEDSRPRIQGFAFTTAANAALAANTSALVDHEAGLIVIEAVYTTDPPPYSLIPEFAAGGTVSVNGAIQTSGLNGQDFSRKVKYTVRDPGNPGLYRDYWAEVRFVKHSLSLAEISEFRFDADAADNPGLCNNVTAVIDQGAGTIYAVLPFDGLPPADGGHRSLKPRWLAQGTVTVGGVVQESGVNGVVFSSQALYRVVSADGTFYKDYTVTVLEVNTRIYVDADATGNNTGVSWANAFKNLADACAASENLPANLPAEIWIAEGTYRPSENRDSAAYFKVRGNTGYYGGFAGTEASKDERIPAAHPVIITGDLGGGVNSRQLFMNMDLQNRNAAFDGMTFTKARALTGTAASGAAICVNLANNISVTNAVFEDLQSSESGGAVFAHNISGTVIIRDCDFEGIRAGSSGGAVRTLGGSVTIMDCSFTNIEAGSGSGAVTAESSFGSISITDSSFTNIEASSGEGAVHAHAFYGGSVTLTGCDFIDTKSDLHSGAVLASASSSGSVTITDCDFTNTESGNGSGAVTAQSDSGSITITGCGFENTSGRDGGAVYASASSGSVTITDCRFENTSGRYGGAVYASASTGSMSITGCTFKDTWADEPNREYSGGAVYASSSGSVSITDCDFENTESSSCGAVYTRGSTIVLTGCKFKKTVSRGPGGAVYASASGFVSITDCTFTSTQARAGGGAVSASSSGGSVSITGCGFEGTVSGGIGGAVYASASSGGSVSITGCTFKDTVSERSDGGAVHTSSFGSLTITDCRFENTSGSYGGAVSASASSSSGSMNITGCTFKDTVSESSGGAVYTSSFGSLTITDCRFENTSGSYGGAVSASASYGGSVTITDCHFENTSGSSGGAVRASASSGSVTITKCGFENTESGDDGGTVYASGGSVTIMGCTFKSTESGRSGGAVYAATSSGSVRITGCGFEGTVSGNHGGAVCAYSGSGGSMNITGCTFKDTVSESSGGAVSTQSDSGSVSITDCGFENTESGSDGGAVFTSSSSVTITACGFTNTVSGSDGGAVYASGQIITISGYASIAARAARNGGSLYVSVSNGGSASVSNAIITGSEAINAGSGNIVYGGGGIYITGGSSASPAAAEFSNINFNTVQAAGSADHTTGGAIFLNRYIRLTMTDCSIEEAESKRGGAIGGSGQAACTLNRVSFTDCTATQGSILFGNAYNDASGIGPKYTIRPGCRVNGKEITSDADLDLVLPSPSMRHLINGSTIEFAPAP